MTGAAVPAGADAVVMIEYTQRAGELVRFERETQPGQNIVLRGSEARAGQTILKPGMRLGFAEFALASQVGAARVQGAFRPRLVILSHPDFVPPTGPLRQRVLYVRRILACRHVRFPHR